MSDKQKPRVHDMFKFYKMDCMAFEREVSRALSPKPWLHITGEIQVAGGTSKPAELCRKCRRKFPQDSCTRCGFMTYSAPGCPIPPSLHKPFEVVAEELRDRVCGEHAGTLKLACKAALILQKVIWPLSDIVITSEAVDWYAFHANPYERIAVCLVALELWTI